MTMMGGMDGSCQKQFSASVRNLPRPKFHETGSRPTCFSECGINHDHGIPKLFSGVSITYHKGTWKDGENYCTISKQTPAWKIFHFVLKGGCNFTCPEKKKQLIRLFSSSFTAAHSKFCKYFKEGAQPASKFLHQIQVLDPTNLSDVEHDFTSIDSIPGFQAVSKQEWSLNVNHLGPLSKPAKMETLT